MVYGKKKKMVYEKKNTEKNGLRGKKMEKGAVILGWKYIYGAV